jgi:hypothetical protein
VTEGVGAQMLMNAKECQRVYYFLNAVIKIKTGRIGYGNVERMGQEK